MSVLEDVFGGMAPQTIDDAWRPVALNGEPATANLIAQEIFLANQCAHAGRPFYTWAYDNIVTGDCTSMFRQVYMAANRGAYGGGPGRAREQGRALVMDHQFDPDGGVGYQDGQGLRVVIGTSSHDTPLNFTDPPNYLTYPSSARVVTYANSFGMSTKPAEVIIGALTTNNPQPRAGSIWQNPCDKVDSAGGSAIGSHDVHPKGDIVAIRSSGDDQLASLSNSIRDTWYHQRPQCGWSAVNPGTGINYVEFSSSRANFRYIFNQAYGDSGTTITSTSPAITLPLFNAASGLTTQVRVYAFVYAAMSGNRDLGFVAVANKGASGTMGTPTLLTDITISGTGYQWYPTLSTWSPTTANWFPGYAGGAFDRVALCAAAGGSTDKVRIAAYTFIVAPSTT